ncbi:MAG: hypothetical protein JNL28_00965 [Planctomycetes bacterium]|nr:hypothetical protein [Planctomycetota bacterium]
MKTLLSSVAVILLVGGGVAFSQGQGPTPPPAPRSDSVEKDVAELRQKCDALAAELAETKTLLTKTITYLDAQSKSASAMAATLDESERAGFTFGINPESRQILLRGWREQLTALQQAVPVAPAPKPETAKTGDGKTRK